MPPGCCRPCRHLLPDRPRDDGPRSGLRTGPRPIRSTRLGPGFRARISRRGLDLRDAPVALRRRAGDLVLGAVPLRAAVRPLLDRVVDHAAEEESRCSRADPRQDRAHLRRQCRADDGDERMPLAYSKDMQEDKGAGLRRRRQPDARARRDGRHGARHVANREALEAAAGSGFSTATDLADWLVRVLGLPFREAHHVTGSLVAMAEAGGVDLPDLSLEQMRSVHPGITADIFDVLGVHNSSPRAPPTVAQRRARSAPRSHAGRNSCHDHPSHSRRDPRPCAACGLRGGWRPRTPGNAACRGRHAGGSVSVGVSGTL